MEITSSPPPPIRCLSQVWASPLWLLLKPALKTLSSLCPGAGGLPSAKEATGQPRGSPGLCNVPNFAICKGILVVKSYLSGSCGLLEMEGWRGELSSRSHPTPLPHPGGRAGPRCSHVLAPTTRTPPLTVQAGEGRAPRRFASRPRGGRWGERIWVHPARLSGSYSSGYSLVA